MRLLSAVKTAIIPDERKPRKVVFGPFQGIRLDLSLKDRLQMYLGLYERETYPWIRRLSAGIKTGIDIGAAEGEFALLFLLHTNAEKVIAFEPSSECLAIFRQNLESNGLEHSDKLKIVRSLAGQTNSDTTVSLDSMAASLSCPCLIKLDVDGGEADVLEGAKELNRLPGVRWLIETHSVELENSCLDLLGQAGFQTKIIKNAWWRLLLPEMRPLAQNRWLVAWKSEA